MPYSKKTSENSSESTDFFGYINSIGFQLETNTSLKNSAITEILNWILKISKPYENPMEIAKSIDRAIVKILEQRRDPRYLIEILQINESRLSPTAQRSMSSFERRLEDLFPETTYLQGEQKDYIKAVYDEKKISERREK